jgi:hypothetical protein
LLEGRDGKTAEEKGDVFELVVRLKVQDHAVCNHGK